MGAMDVLLQYGVDLQVEHIPGAENVIVDALLRFQNKHVLNVHILTFEPP